MGARHRHPHHQERQMSQALTRSQSRSTPLVLAMAMVWMLAASAARAQSTTADGIFQSQAAMIGRLFSGLAEAPASDQLFALRMADVMLAPGQGPMGAAGLEDVVATGGLEALRN